MAEALAQEGDSFPDYLADGEMVVAEIEVFDPEAG